MASTACAGAGERGAEAGDAQPRGVRARSSHAAAGGDADMAPRKGAFGAVCVRAEAPLRSTPLYTPRIQILQKNFPFTFISA